MYVKNVTLDLNFNFTSLFGYIHISHKHEVKKKGHFQKGNGNFRYIPLKRKYNDTITNKTVVNTSKLIVASVSRETISAKTTQTSSKNPVQKQHLSLYGPPYASKKGFIYCINFWQQHMYFDSGPSNNGIVKR